MKFKDLILKLQKGEELTDDEIKEVDEADTKLEEEEKSAKLTEMINKLIDAREKKEEILETKTITKEKVKSMSKEEKKDAFFKALVRNDHSSLVALQGKSNYQSEGANANGGYLVPDETFSEIVDNTMKVSVIRPNARVITNCPAHLDVTGLAGKSTANFRSEAAGKASSTMKFSTQAITPYSVAVIVKVTNELLEDAMVDIGSFIVDEMVETIAQKEDQVFANGNGSGLPTGLEQYYSAYPAARKILNSTYGDIEDRLAAADATLETRYRTGAKWYMPTSQLVKIRQVSTSNGFLFQPDATGQFAGLLMGKPVLTNDNLTNIWFGDLKQAYWIGQAGGMGIARSTEATVGGDNLWEQNMTGFRVEERIDGEIVNNKALIAIEAE